MVGLFWGWYKLEWLHKWGRWAKLPVICWSWIWPWSYTDLHSQTLWPGRVRSRFFTASFKSISSGKELPAHFPCSLPSSWKYVSTYVIMTPQKPFGIICVLYKDTVFVSKMETSPWTIGKGEVDCDLSILYCKYLTPVPTAGCSVHINLLRCCNYFS